MKSKFKNSEELIKDSKKIFGENTLDYMDTVFVNTETHSLFRCIEHNFKFKQSITGHLKGYHACKECSKKVRGNSRRFTNEILQQRSDKLFGKKFDLSGAICLGNTIPILIKTIECEHVFSQTPSGFLGGSGNCLVCSNKIPITTEILIQRGQQRYRNPDGTPKFLYPNAVYINNITPFIFECPKHGVLIQTPANHFTGNFPCKECAELERTYYNADNLESLIRKSKLKFGERFGFNRAIYINSLTKFELECFKHSFFTITPASHLSSTLGGCPLCASEATGNRCRMTTEEFIFRAKVIHGDRYDYSKVVYINNNTPVCIICKIHGEFWQRPKHHLTGSHCSNGCKTSKFEIKLFKKINENFNEVIKQFRPDFLKTKTCPQSLDIYLPQYKIGVEYQGEQHFKPIKGWGGEKIYINLKNRDERKLKLCMENDITVLYYTYEPKHVPPDYPHKVYTDESELIKKINDIINKKSCLVLT